MAEPVKVVERPCGMVDCEYCREMEIDPDQRDMAKAMNLSDRVVIMERCAHCRFFDRFTLFMRKKEGSET